MAADTAFAMVLVVMGAVFAAFGVVLVRSFTGGLVGMLRASSNAEAVRARVLSTSIDAETLPNPDSGGDTTLFEPAVTFEFEYDGETHERSAVYPAGVVPTKHRRSSAEDLLDDYTEDTMATAHVPFGDPERAYLVDPSTLFVLKSYATAIAATIFGGFMAFGGVGLVAFGLVILLGL